MIGLDINLVDQEAMLHQPTNEQPDPADLLYLNPSTAKSSATSSNPTNSVRHHAIDLTDSNPWWLRNTTYLENNLFSQTTRNRSDNVALSEIKKRLTIDRELDSNPENFAALKSLSNKVEDNIDTDDSFSLVDITLKKLIEKNKKSGVSLEWSYDIFPNNQLENQTISFVRYNETPIPTVNITGMIH